jgi:GDP/UDP-N,N'-diacetylbacillosamine 2-epimerase (hydrolysing)
MKRRICVLTGTRAEYGLLRWVMEGVRREPELELQTVVTGMHLSPDYGLTYREIEADGFRIDRKLDMLLAADTPAAITKSMGLGLIGSADWLQELRPDVLVVLGDRFEIFSAVAAALIARVPVAHLHGGELTEGAFDDALRHSITKMSHLHFVAAQEYRRRVIQLGEQPDRVFCVGGLGVDSITKLKLLEREELENALGFELGARSLLITFHPATLEGDVSSRQMTELLAALHDLTDTQLVFTMPNADTHSRVLRDLIGEFVTRHPNARAYESLGSLRYLSCVRQVDAVVGNSSSGLTEVPTFRKATINIGERQRGRLRAASVIDCEPDRVSIADALQRLYLPTFRASLDGVRNPYGDGGASERIVQQLAQQPLTSIIKKTFYDIASNVAS